jgi:hypothetical protein
VEGLRLVANLDLGDNNVESLIADAPDEHRAEPVTLGCRLA